MMLANAPIAAFATEITTVLKRSLLFHSFTRPAATKAIAVTIRPNAFFFSTSLNFAIVNVANFWAAV